MKRVPIVPTILVALAVVAMIALGIWQLDRRQQKAVALAQFAANIGRPPIAFPRFGSGEGALFRRSSLVCLRTLGQTQESGRAADGTPGWRQIVECATGAEGPGVFVQLGVARSSEIKLGWHGGAVAGYITHAPDHRPLLAGLFDRAPKRLMLVADRPAPGLAANPPPDLSSVPNNHLAYAVQWFIFAALAVVIYVLALRRRDSRTGGH